MIAVNVSQLLKQAPGVTREFDFAEPLPELQDDLDLVGPVQGRAHLIRTSRGILVRSEYRTTVRQSCGRCLGPTLIEVQGGSDDEFTPLLDVNTGYVLSEPPASEELAIDEHHVLNLTEVIRQDLLTRLPLQPLCEVECPGLCSGCGQELRADKCACGEGSGQSSPFAKLAELFTSDGPKPNPRAREGG